MRAVIVVAAACVSGCFATPALIGARTNSLSEGFYEEAPPPVPEPIRSGGSTHAMFAVSSASIPMTLRPGSMVEARFDGADLPRALYVVDDIGGITFDGGVWLPADGVTIGELAQTITAVTLTDPRIQAEDLRVTVRLVDDMAFHVEGAVNAPGAFAHVTGTTARDAVAAAGGLSRGADPGSVVVMRDGETIPDALGEQPVSLRPGDVVRVARAGL